MYEYDYEHKKKREEPEVKLKPFDQSIEFVLTGMTAAALIFFFLKVMFF